MKKLLEFYPSPLTNGLFYHMSQDDDLKKVFAAYGVSSDDDYHAIDFDYIFNQSGLKKISVALWAITQNYVIDIEDGVQSYVTNKKGQKVLWDYVLLDVDKTLINTIIKNRFLRKWKDLVATLDISYDALSPFNIEIAEKRKNVAASKSTNNSSYSDTDKNTTTNIGTVQNTGTEGDTISETKSGQKEMSGSHSDVKSTQMDYSNTGNVDNKVFGFNSSTAQDKDTSAETGSGSNTTNEDGTKTFLDKDITSETNSKTDNKTKNDTRTDNLTETSDGTGSGSRTGEGSYDRTDDTTRSITRKGNIGNHTMQELIKEQREVLRYQFLKEVYLDLDSILTSLNY